MRPHLFSVADCVKWIHCSFIEEALQSCATLRVVRLSDSRTTRTTGEEGNSLYRGSDGICWVHCPATRGVDQSSLPRELARWLAVKRLVWLDANAVAVAVAVAAAAALERLQNSMEEMDHGALNAIAAAAAKEKQSRKTRVAGRTKAPLQ